MLSKTIKTIARILANERTSWILAVTCALMATLLQWGVSKREHIAVKYLEDELFTTRQDYYSKIDAYRAIVKSYSKLKTVHYNDSITIQELTKDGK